MITPVLAHLVLPYVAMVHGLYTCTRTMQNLARPWLSLWLTLLDVERHELTLVFDEPVVVASFNASCLILQEEVLAFRRRVLPEDHPHIANRHCSLNGSGVYRD